MDADPDEIICWAHEIGAAFDFRGSCLFVVRFKAEDVEDLPRVSTPYGADELRSIFRFHARRQGK
jgi:hypothetical protein